jgi:hypothetical protein
MLKLLYSLSSIIDSMYCNQIVLYLYALNRLNIEHACNAIRQIAATEWHESAAAVVAAAAAAAAVDSPSPLLCALYSFFCCIPFTASIASVNAVVACFPAPSACVAI